MEHAYCSYRIQDQPNVDTGDSLGGYFGLANADVGLHREPDLADPDDYGNLDLVAPEPKTRVDKR